MTGKDDATLKALLNKRAELTDELEIRQAAVRECRVNLEHLDGAIRLLAQCKLSKASPQAMAQAMFAERGQFAEIMFGKLVTLRAPVRQRTSLFT